MDKQLIELQSQFAFQEDVLRELNEVVTKQQAQINTLEQELSQCTERLTEVETTLRDNLPDTAADEVPPHY